MPSVQAWEQAQGLYPNNQYMMTRVWLALTENNGLPSDPTSREIGREIDNARSQALNIRDTPRN